MIVFLFRARSTELLHGVPDLELLMQALETGAHLAAIQKKKHGMQGIGVTMSGPNIPYLETMAARGVLGTARSML